MFSAGDKKKTTFSKTTYFLRFPALPCESAIHKHWKIQQQTTKLSRSLVTRLKHPPPQHSATGVAIPLSHCVFVVSQTIAATPPILSIKKSAYRNSKTDLGRRGIAEEACLVLCLSLASQKIAITIASVLKSQIQNRNSHCRFRRKIAEKSRNEIANR